MGIARFKGVAALVTMVADAIKTSSGVALRWPAADGTAGQVLRTNGSGVLSWVDNGDAGEVSLLEDTSVVGWRLDNGQFDIPWGYNFPTVPTYRAGSLAMAGPVDGTTRIGEYGWSTVVFSADGSDTRVRVIGDGSTNAHLELGTASQRDAELWYDIANARLTLDALAESAGGNLRIKTLSGSYDWPATAPAVGQFMTVASVASGVGTMQLVVNPEVTCPDADAGNYRLRIAPNEAQAITALAASATLNLDFDPGANGYYHFSFSILVKLAGAATYRAVKLNVDATRVAGSMTLEGTQVAIPGGNSAGLTVTLSPTGGSVRVSILNSTGEVVNGRCVAGWAVEDLIT